MKIKKYTFSTVAAVGLIAGTMTAGPAMAVTDPYYDPILQGSMNIELDYPETGIEHVTGWNSDSATTIGTNVTHSNGGLYFVDSQDNWYDAWCDTDTATRTTDGSDVVVECSPVQLVESYFDDPLIPSTAFAGLSITPEYRVYAPDANGIVLARVLYKITNTSASDITAATIGTEVNWDECSPADGPMFTNKGQFTLGTQYTDDTETRWVNTAYYDSTPALESNYTSFGSAWRAADSPVFTKLSGEPYDDEDIWAESSGYVFKAGSTVYFAFFSVYQYVPAVSISSLLAADSVTQTNAYMARFEGSLTGSLRAGIPSDAWVVNWEPDPSLAETGVEGSDGLLLVGAFMLLVGASAVVLRRRRNI